MVRQYQKCLTAIFVVIVNAFLLGLFGVLARIKQPMAQQFSLSQDFLGTLDSLTFIGGIFGFIYVVIYPCKKPVRDLTLQCIGVIIFLEFYYLAKIFGHQKIFLIIGTLLSGFGRSYTVVAFTIINHHFNKSKCDKIILQICFAAALVGDIASVLISDYMITQLNIDWAMTLNIYLIAFLIFTGLMFILIQQISMNKNSQNDNIAALKQAKQFILKYSKNLSNILHAIMFSVTSSGYYMMLMWLPYYFMKIGYETEACWISSVYPVAYMIGIFMLQPIQRFFGKHIGKILLICLILATICSIMLTFLGNQQSQIPYYIIYLGLSTILTSGCTARVTTVEIEERAKSNTQFMIISSFLRLIQQLFFGINLQISGILMDQNIHSFFYIQIFYCFVSVAVILVRITKYPRDFILKIKHQISSDTFQNQNQQNIKGCSSISTLSSDQSLRDELIIQS